MLNVVNTRAVVDPDYAVKLSGKRGPNTFGLLVASDAAPGNFSEEERTDPDLRADVERHGGRNSTVGVLRLKRDLGREHSLGLFATTSNFVDRHNHLAGLDGRFRLSRQTTLSFQLAGTHTRGFFYDPDLDAEVYRTGNGLGYAAFAWREGRNSYVSVGAFGRSHFYRADVGFTRRTDNNSAESFIRYRTEPRADSAFTFWGLTSFNRVQYDSRGRLQGWNAGARNYFNFARQSWLGFGFDNYYERLYEDEFGPRRTAARRGAFAGAPSRGAHNKVFYFGGASVPHRMFSAEVNVFLNYGALDLDFGAGPRFPRVSPAALSDPDPSDGDEPPLDPGPGRSLYLEAGLAFQPTGSLRLALDYTKNSLTRDDTGRVAFDDNIYSLRATYQFTRFTFARARLDFNTLSSNARGQFLWGWAPNPGTSFYVGYNDDLNRNGFNPFTGHPEPGLRRNTLQFFIKLSYLLRRSFN
ncbi:MAG TPA: hypothetical protein VG148_11425 [Pyrinomonadaceae bacterium]|nr:hypothetical protein [Pyrinomonadaceae bacterium]